MKELEKYIKISVDRFTSFEFVERDSGLIDKNLVIKLLENYRISNYANEHLISTSSEEIKEILNLLNEHRILENYKNELNENKIITGLVEDLMINLKEYPKYGSIYYKIINLKYLSKKDITYEKIAKKLQLAKQTVLNKKDEAITIIVDLLTSKIK